MIRKIFLLMIWVQIFANDIDTLRLEEDLQEVSTIATKSKLNVAQTPAVVSVLHSSELKKLGITTLYEALSVVPGVELSMGTAGAKQLNMRGSVSFIRDRLKLMIDGVSINSELIGGGYFYLDMPLDLIERIEVIRGPASVLYGSMAHVGVINVITKNSLHKERLLSYTQSSEGFKSGSFVQNLQLNELDIGIDGYFNKNDKSRSYHNYSTLNAIQRDFTSYEDYTDKSLGLNLRYKELSFKSRFLEHRTQNFYGYGDWPIVQDPKKIKINSFFGELEYKPKITATTSLDMKVGMKQYNYRGTARYVPYSVMPATYPYDLLGKGMYKERVLYSDISLLHKTAHNELLMGVYGARADEIKTDYKVNNPAQSEAITIAKTNIKKDIAREQYAFYLNDIYAFSQSISFDFGVRYDYYSDTDAAIAPKIGVMYAYDDKQNYKLLYQRSFRAPSFLEMYGRAAPYFGKEDLQSETIDTIEFVYHRQSGFNSWLNLNLYYSKMSDFIDRDNNFHFFNADDIYSYGMEIELKYPLDATTTLQANYSYVDTEDSYGETKPLISKELANLMLFKQFTANFESGTRLQYIGSKKRESADIRDEIGSKVLLDQTFTYRYKSFTLTAAIKDILNQKVVYPSKLGVAPTTGTYEDDFVRDGRTFWFNLIWKMP